MVPMVKIALGAAVVVVVVVLLTWLVRRRSSDEVHSVDGYRSTLDTLEGIRTRSGSGTVRVLGGPPAPADASAPGEVPAAGTRGPADGPEGEPARGSGRGPVVEDDASGPNATSLRSQRSQDRAISAMNRRPRRLAGPVAVVVVVLALLAAVLVIGARSHHPKAQSSSHSHHDSATSTTTTRTGAGGTTTTSGSKNASGGKGATTTTAPKAPTSTTVPRTYTAATSTPTTATYTPPSGSYTLTVAATTGSCWVTVRSSSGTVLLSQTLAAGEVKQVANPGSATIVIGAPSALRVTIDHRPVVLPAGYQTPFTITLTPST